MANTLKDLSASLRETIKKAAAYTVGLEREPYAVSGVLIGGDRVLTASHLVPDEGIGVLMPDGAFAGILVFNRRMGAEVVIPADIALARAKLLEEKGSVKRPYLGVRSQAVKLPRGAQETGLLLVTVEKGSAADAAGLEVGDIIVSFGGTPVLDHEALVGALAEKGAGAKVDVQILRGGTSRTVSLTVGAQ